MITQYGLFSARCDLCNRDFPGEGQHPVIYFPSHEIAEQTIVANGWIVMHNIEESFPRILCPGCNREAETVMESAECSGLPKESIYNIFNLKDG